MAKFREEVERERIEKENAIRRMKQNEEQKDQEIADLRDKLSRASLLTPQVNIFHVLIHSSLSSSPFILSCVARSILLDFWSFKVNKQGRWVNDE